MRLGHRCSLRLKGYDYSQSGAYFVTICTTGRLCLFGEVVEDRMRLNAYGEVVSEEWLRGADLRPYLQLSTDEFVVMPNHIHGIVRIVADAASHHVDGVGARRRRAPTEGFGKPVSGSIPTIIRAFKAATTKRIRAATGAPPGAVWQRNYYEHVIRNEKSLDRIRQYIADNPLSWAIDPDNPASVTPEPKDAWRT